MGTLPTLPSAILTIAMEDFAAVQAMPGMTINMGIWVVYKDENADAPPCEACLAGAVMLRQFSESASKARENSDSCVTPSMMELPKAAKMALYMLNDFAQGDFALGLDGYLSAGLDRPWLNAQQAAIVLNLEKRFSTLDIQYDNDPVVWTAFMLEARDVLARIGL